MRDVLTKQIIRELDKLPTNKKKALLELIKTDSTSSTIDEKEQREKWRKELLTTSVWSDAEIEEIYKAREYINSWKPKEFF